MPKSERAFFESRIGTDFSQVRVHSDSKAAQVAQAINAHAFTVGHNVVFGQGWYVQGAYGGRKLLAHELTHVLQQRHRSQSDRVRRTIGDGHDLQSPRFAGNPRLEAAFDNESYVQTGTRGEHVVILQQALVDAGHPLPKYGVDGIFGPETRGAVKSYQEDRSLRVDGIVGPETMGDLDQLYAKSPLHPKIPPGPPDVCSNLLFEQKAFADENGLIFLGSLNSKQRKAAEKLPKVDIPNGETAIECKAPSNKKSCANLCGCPLPTSNYKAKVGDLAQVMENATSFHEKDPKSNQDTRKLLCPPKGEPIKILKIIPSAASGGITFLKVLFCNGSLLDKSGKMVTQVFIQQRFVEKGKQLSIKGYNVIYTSVPERLRADGAPSRSKPDWSIEKDFDDNKKMGWVYFLGSNKKSEVIVKGAIGGDVIIKVSVCGKSAFRKLTVREWPPKKSKPKPKPKYSCGKRTDKPSEHWALKFKSYMANPLGFTYNVGMWFDLKNMASKCEYDAEFWGKLKKGVAGGFSLSDRPKYVEFKTTKPLQPIDFGDSPWAKLLDLPLYEVPFPGVGVLLIRPDNRIVPAYVKFVGVGVGLGAASAYFEGTFFVK